MAIQPQRIVVLGSNSFTGSNFVNYVLEKTSCEVIGMSRSEEYHPVFLAYRYRKENHPRFRFHQIDVNTGLDRAMEIMDSFRPDVVVNYAAQSEVRNSWKWAEQWYQTNCLGVVRLVEKLKDRSFLKKYIAISTPEVYGTTGENIKESHNYFPSTPYAASKLAGDGHLFACFKHYQFPVTFTRAANLYGIHQQLYRIVPKTVIFRKLGKKIDLHGHGKSVRAFIHARDVADATFKAITHGRDGEVYHVAPKGELRSIGSVVQLVCEAMGHKFEDSINLVDENFGQDACFSMDPSKAIAELGWIPAVRFEDGVTEVVRWISDNWDFIKDQPAEYVHKK